MLPTTHYPLPTIPEEVEQAKLLLLAFYFLLLTVLLLTSYYYLPYDLLLTSTCY